MSDINLLYLLRDYNFAKLLFERSINWTFFKIYTHYQQ
jgi:hypothetical protein